MRTLVVSKLSKASRANLDWWSFPLGGVIWSHGVMVILRRAPSLNHRATQIRRNVLKARDCKSSKSFRDSHIFQRKRSPKITNKSKKMKPMHKNVREKKKVATRVMPGAQIWIWSSTTNKRLASSSAGWLQQKSQGRNTVRSIRNKPLTFDKSDKIRIVFFFVNWPKNVITPA